MAHHEPLKALGPIQWADVTGDEPKNFLTTTFSHAQTIINSIPPLPESAAITTTATTTQQTSGRARSHTESSVPAHSPEQAERTGRDHANTTAGGTDASAAAAAAHAAQLLKEWKEVKVPPRDNPMDISVFKLAGKDGRGAWFARRSLHRGVAFDKFRLGLEREFGETMKNSKGPGTGNVRGIGAERRAEHLVCDGVGKAEVWLLSAQFPGPTTPRDFLTLLLSGASGGEDHTGGKGEGKAPRQFMVVSRPCDHPECQPRSGFIRGNYESVEIIREVPIEKPVRRARSSTDLKKGEELQLPSRPAQDVGHEGDQSMSQSVPRLSDPGAEDDSAANAGLETEMAIEWVMVTRSDPGGSVPRFMVEKGTPGGIVSDAGRFIKWLDSKKTEDLKEPPADKSNEGDVEGESETPTSRQEPSSVDGPGEVPDNADLSSSQEEIQPSGFYNMIAGALGAVSSRIPGFATSASGAHTDSDDSYSESEGSERSFASAREPEPGPEALAQATTTAPGENTAGTGAENASMHSVKSDESSTKASSQHDKALKKLQERQRKVEEKMARQQERNVQSKQNQNDDDALAKLREKHEKELARQEENYRKEVRKIEEKREKEEKKAEEKRRKQQEKEERENVSMQLEKVKAERDVALKQIEILKEQVGLLQAQNTKLVAHLDQASAADGAGKLDEEKLSQTSSGSK